MSCKSCIRFASILVLPLPLLLSACGGGGGMTHVADVPPPPPTPTPTPTPTTSTVQESWLDSPATRNGSYDLIGRLKLVSGGDGSTTSRVTAPNEFSMSTFWYFGRDSGDIPWYTLKAGSGVLPAGLTSITVNGPFLSWSFDPSQSYVNEPRGTYCCQLLGQRLTADNFSYDFTRGTTTSQVDGTNGLQVSLDYDIGYSYVAMGDWDWKEVATGNSGELLFVEGDRTPESGIPTSGTATYDARSLSLLSSNGTPGIPFTLTADFGQRTIATRIDQDFQNSAAVGGAPIEGIHVGGAAPFSNDGSFDIPLIGTINFSNQNLSTSPASEAATGDMNGAFFGPHAEQVGGTFVLQRPGDQLPLFQDAFVGQQHPH